MADVVIYTRLFCGYCARAKALLDRKGVAYQEIDAGFDAEKRKEMIQRADGRSTYPQIFIDDHGIGGSDELDALERAGKLDAVLNGVGKAS